MSVMSAIFSDGIRDKRTRDTRGFISLQVFKGKFILRPVLTPICHGIPMWLFVNHLTHYQATKC